jgi:hypothetical protein
MIEGKSSIIFHVTDDFNKSSTYYNIPKLAYLYGMSIIYSLAEHNQYPPTSILLPMSSGIRSFNHYPLKGY